ncbi:non-specific lipid-transfer protein 1-like [Silene latifolia]|uniref:non-specific lipid-transfer protein 1-like n=1 Tax=Silene latifolia TaxID=37657 RepID=UPI003D774D93
MAGSTILKLGFAILVCIAMATPRVDASIACGQVTEKLAPCLGFLESGRGPVPGCCKGVRDLNSMAVTTEDRRNACRCMKTAAAAFPSISSVYSAALPGKCGVSIPLAAGAKTDCSKIQ